MKVPDIIILVLNVIITICSGIGAYKSFRYFNKSKYITIYAQTNQALNEISEMLDSLPKALSTVTTKNKGVNLEYYIQGVGRNLADHLNNVMGAIPSTFSSEFRRLQKTKGFILSGYINSFIDGSALVEENGRKTLNRKSFDACQECLRSMQEFLKRKIEDEAEKLK